MALGQPDPNQENPAEGMAGQIPTILKILAGAGLKNASKSVLDFSNVGADIKGILSEPLLMAGVGIEALGVPPEQIMAFLTPPKPPEQQKPQIPISALLPTLTSRLGPGRTGIQAGQMPPLPQPQPMGAPMGMGGIPPPPTLAGM